MVELGISEFTFGYAFLYEQKQKNWGSLVTAPILPSLRQETKKGWDARLPIRGCDFYYQFKLSDRLERGNAKFITDKTYKAPYYRIKLHTRNFNRQHQILWQHAQSNPNTYYVAPEFVTLKNFNKAFLSNTITEHSRLIPLSQCDNFLKYDSSQHYITYQENDSRFCQHSESLWHEKSRSGKELETIYNESRQSWRPINEDFVDRIFDQTKKKFVNLAEEERDPSDFLGILEENDNQDMIGKLLLSAKVLSVVFGVSMVIIGERVDGRIGADRGGYWEVVGG
ncbi:MAG: hypothetical protein C3F06_02800 [Candidatus Methanoperedenaceae archaeon]|nr:MAG: hypothetical protein C3F06_02800 [Candidatus Methanoperedenaceae archaeon]